MSRRFIVCNIFNVALFSLNVIIWFSWPTTTINRERPEYLDDLRNRISYDSKAVINCTNSLLENPQLLPNSQSENHPSPLQHTVANVSSENPSLTNFNWKNNPDNIVGKTGWKLRPSSDDEYRAYQIPSIERTQSVNCAAILEGDKLELEKAENDMLAKPKVPIFEEEYLNWTSDCENFKRQRGYVLSPLSREEEDFPLAFSLTMFADVEQAERLLRAIYQPQNLYCIHVDTKSSLLIHRTMRAIANCFDNVWIATHLDKIKWGDISVVLLDVNCMRDLVKYFRGRYKYFINLTGQEFPLRTNLELVRIARVFNGSNDIAGSASKMDMERVAYRWKHRWSKTYQQTIYYKTAEHHEPYPVNLTFFKGELHGLFSRRMTEYIVESEHGRNYLSWCSDTGHPSEHYYNTLNYNSHLRAPGGYSGPLDAAHAYSNHPAIRVKNWVGMYDKLPCHGEVVRGICIYGIRDAVWLAKRKELFANKFRLTYQYLALNCLEERHRNRTMLREKIDSDLEYYRSLPTVLYGRKDGVI